MKKRLFGELLTEEENDDLKDLIHRNLYYTSHYIDENTNIYRALKELHQMNRDHRRMQEQAQKRIEIIENLIGKLEDVVEKERACYE